MNFDSRYLNVEKTRVALAQLSLWKNFQLNYILNKNVGLQIGEKLENKI